ncbi:MAG: biotin--[acetyl-CoA-carboxylase] ligase [Alphaproteobacteria bacterium]
MSIALPAGYRLEIYDRLLSTSTTAAERLAAGDPGGLWVVAAVQDGGRGRRGRAWSTERGNLAASLALVDPAPRDRAATLSFVAALALHQAIVACGGPALGERLALKWPNDVLLDGFKIAGILVEGHALKDDVFGVVTGFGVNCVRHPGIEGPFPSASLRDRGVPVDATRLLAALADSFAGELERWNRGAGFAVTRRAWLARASGLGDPVTVRMGEREIHGRFEALDDSGQLVLRNDDGRRQLITAGDVFFSDRKQGRA